jgi:hypothetical protein
MDHEPIGRTSAVQRGVGRRTQDAADRQGPSEGVNASKQLAGVTGRHDDGLLIDRDETRDQRSSEISRRVRHRRHAS